MSPRRSLPLYLISYDISNHRLRRKMADCLLDYGDRVQYSVFEAYLSQEQIQELIEKTKHFLNTATDSMRIYPLCLNCQRKRIVEGKDTLTEARDEDIVII